MISTPSVTCSQPGALAGGLGEAVASRVPRDGIPVPLGAEDDDGFPAGTPSRAGTRRRRLLTRDPLALLVGMLLDQQFPMERAFAGPYADRRAARHPDRLDPSELAGHDPDEFAAIMTGPPAVHRYPGSMAERVQALAAIVVDEYGGDAAALWTTAATGARALARLQALPGFGEQKARIFVALLGKQLGVRPDGLAEAAGAYGEDGSRRSVADVVDAEHSGGGPCVQAGGEGARRRLGPTPRAPSGREHRLGLHVRQVRPSHADSHPMSAPRDRVRDADVRTPGQEVFARQLIASPAPPSGTVPPSSQRPSRPLPPSR